MSQRQRVLLSIAAAALIVAAFVVLRPGDSDDPGTTAQTGSVPTVTVGAQPPIVTTAEPAPPAPRPKYVLLRAQGLRPVGGLKKITVSKGDMVRFEIRSDQADQGHLHGYDISKPVGPGRRARYRFTANLEGIFEIELENAGVPVGELRVNP